MNQRNEPAAVTPFKDLAHFAGYYCVVDAEAKVAVFCSSEIWTQRIAELVAHHGLADVPDDCAELSAAPGVRTDNHPGTVDN